MSKKLNIPKYIKTLIKKYPKIISGRKNYLQHHIRIIDTIEITKQYFKNKK